MPSRPGKSFHGASHLSVERLAVMVAVTDKYAQRGVSPSLCRLGRQPGRAARGTVGSGALTGTDGGCLVQLGVCASDEAHTLRRWSTVRGVEVAHDAIVGAR